VSLEGDALLREMKMAEGRARQAVEALLELREVLVRVRGRLRRSR
jgi:hypothetical protein